MNTATFDTHTAVNALTRAGVATEQAEAIADTGRIAVSEGVATKTDIANIIGRSFSRLKNLLKFVGLSLSLMFFSLNVFAEMTFLPCHEVTQQSYDEYKPVYENDPGNVKKIYSMSVKAICLGKMAEGMTLLERSSDGGHVEGSFYMAVYYETDKTFDTINRNITKDSENFNASLFYYKRAVAQIEANPNYPEDTYSNIPYLEEHNQTSVKVFTTVPIMYYKGYINAVNDMLNNVDREVYIDTLEALEKMKQSSEQCLARPSLPVWKEKQEHAYKVMQVHCQAMRDFSIHVYPLEQKRIRIAEECVSSLKYCSEHNTVVYNEIAPLLTKMVEKYDSISL